MTKVSARYRLSRYKHLIAIYRGNTEPMDKYVVCMGVLAWVRAMYGSAVSELKIKECLTNEMGMYVYIVMVQDN